MKKSILLLATSLLAMTQTFSQKKYPDVDIPYKQYTLDNGLKLIVHEDHKAPIVSFNVWYHVGSKNEKPGKTGFAHLYEHLMFNGSEHYNDDYFKLMDAIGATDLNGTTNNDRTNYFENVPISVLDKVLWIESDRMGFMLKAIDSARLAEQRGVVQNEKREGDNQPYSVLEELTVKATYPASHPYSWTVIGSMADLDAASLDDVKDWFKTYYGPNNAVVVISGDVKADDIFEKVKKYFGEIPAGPPIAHHKDWIAKMTGRSFQVVEDRVPQARLQKVWNIPGWGSEELTRLNMLGDILTTGKSSRLYKRLVYDEQLASSVNFYTDEKEIGGQFYITADAKPGVELEKIEGIINQELKKIITSGITAQELERAKSRYFAGFVKGIERIGGFGGKSDILAMSATYKGSPDYYKQINKMVANATEADLKKVAGDWLSDGEFVAYVLPFGEYAASDKPVDRSKMPDATKDPEVVFPAIKEFSLSNGLKVSLVERKSVPVVNMNLMVNAGFSSDQFAVPGVASLAGRMMMEGTQTKSSIQISDLLADLGAGMSVNSSQDFTTMSMNTLKSNIGGAMELFTDVLFNPSFPQKDFDRVQKQQLLRIKNEQTQPVYMGLRILPRLLYGNGHAYMNPYTGTGFEETVKKITVADLKKFHQDWFAPNNAQLLVVGDHRGRIKPMLGQAAPGKQNGAHEKCQPRQNTGCSIGLYHRQTGRDAIHHLCGAADTFRHRSGF
ncbi:MAG: pitrilysin family protein [Ferruginibacter sp.]